MKNLIFLTTFLFSIFLTGQEISLYNSDGDAVAYIDTTDEDTTIYLWGGEPVAYLTYESGSYNIYGFNGNHLGWYEDGIIRNHEGDAVGFKKGSVRGVYTNYEGYKGYKQYKPYKSYQEYAPYKPYYSTNFSNESLILFLKRGI